MRNERTRLLQWALVMGVVVGSYGCGSADAPEPTALQITSDLSIVLTESGQTTTVHAVLFDDVGNPLDLDVQWESSNPSQISVDGQGRVTALLPTGSALITARYGDLWATLSAVAVKLTDVGVVINSADVFETGDNRIVLRRNRITEALVRGHVVINGGELGFLSRVLDVQVTIDEVVLVVEPAAITDAVAELDVAFQSPAIVPEGFQGGAVDEDSPIEQSAEVGAAHAALTVALDCKLETTLVNVDVKGFAFKPRVDLSTDVELRIRNAEVETFRLALVGDLGIEIGVAEIKIAAGPRGVIKCKAALAPIPFFPIYLFGPIGVAPTATPVAGVNISLEYAAKLALAGARYDKGIHMRGGVEYTRVEGFQLIGEFSPKEPRRSRKEKQQEPLTDELTAKVEPYLGLEYGVAAIVGPVPFGNVSLLGTKIFGGYELTMTTPLSPEELEYRGPRWTLYAGANVNVDPLFKHLSLFAKFLNRLSRDLKGAESLLGFRAKLWEHKIPIFKSPVPSIDLSEAIVQPGRELTFTYSALGDSVGVRAEGLLMRGNEIRSVGEMQTSGSGSEQLRWTPVEGDRGRHTAVVRLYDDIFGDIGLPYASDLRPEVVVRCTGEECPDDEPTPTPQPSPSDCLEADFPFGALDYVDGATFFEERSRVTISTDPRTGVSNVAADQTTRVDWTYDRSARRWTREDVFEDHLRGFTREASTEWNSAAGTPPRCDETGALLGANGTEVIERGDTVDTISWQTGGCHPHYGHGQEWLCEFVDDTVGYQPRDINAP